MTWNITINRKRCPYIFQNEYDIDSCILRGAWNNECCKENCKYSTENIKNVFDNKTITRNNNDMDTAREK